MKIEKKDIAWLIGFILLCQLTGVIGSVFTMPAIPTWYASLTKPSFTPPSWVFAPVWITLYTLMGISLFLVWKQKPPAKSYYAFGTQLALNALWSFAFFGLQSPLAGLIVIVPLLALIALSIVQFNKVSRNAALLLVPYILWGTLATVLNASVWLLNP